MQLTGARIMNYRSIKDVTLKFSHNCRILVGKNETGKSNILKALSLLSDTNNFSAEDKRTLLPNEEFKSDPFVQFHFVLENSEITEVYDNLKTKVLCKNFKSPIIRDNNGTEFTLESFCKLRNSGLYEVNFNNNTRIARYWKIESKYKTINSWMKPRTDAGQPLLVQFGEQAIDLSDYQIINIEEYPEIFTQKMDLLESVTPDYISSLIGKLICSYIDSKRMQTIFWSYDEKNLLPSRINTIEFASNPEICIPLKSMFELAGVDNIYTQTTEALTQSGHSFRNLLERISAITTKHFVNIWKEYPNIQFILSQNGDFIDISIKDTFNHFALSQRSDGFKRFVTFLLLISAKVKKELIKDTLLLIDEPDLCLHPSGIRYLRDELIKISQNNYMVLCTHSIFMIDKNIIERHIIVSKANEITEIKEVDDSNFVEEEVINNALGYSVYDVLSKNNLLFEGWQDKKLFKTALTRISSDYSGINSLKSWGLSHAKGAKQIKFIAPLLELANRRYTIISDSDETAIQRKKEFNELKYSGKWLTYDELMPDCNIKTAEDFIKVKTFIASFNYLRKTIPHLPTVSEENFPLSKYRLSIVEEIILTVEKDTNSRKSIQNSLKAHIYENLKISDIEENYYKLLLKLEELCR